MFFGHESLEVGGSYVIGTALVSTPFHVEAVSDAPEDAHDPHSFLALNPAAIIVVGDIQSQVEAILDAPSLAVKTQPFSGIEPLSRSAGDQSHFLVFAALGLA